MERPIAVKKLYKFTPFNMDASENGKKSNLQYWITQALTSVLDIGLNKLGYSGSYIYIDPTNDKLVIELMFHSEQAVIIKRDPASGSTTPMIRKELRKLENVFVFGNIENSSRMATQTIRYFKENKKGEKKEDRVKRESNIDVLSIQCNPYLLISYIIDHKPTDPNMFVAYKGLVESEAANVERYDPEAFTTRIPCRVQVECTMNPEYEGFDPTDVEDNLYGAYGMEERSRKVNKTMRKSEKAAGDESYEARAKKNTKAKKKSKKSDGKNKKPDKDYGGM